MNWILYGKPVESIDDFPKGAIGFIYRIKYDDSTMYVGKKNLYITRSIKARKDGKERPNTVQRIYRNTGLKFRQPYDIVRMESDWKTYLGSHKEAKEKTLISKGILDVAFTNLQLTYLEAKWLFKLEVLEQNNYLNDNILGKFYRNVIPEIPDTD